MSRMQRLEGRPPSRPASHAETSWPGIGLAVASLIVMPALGAAKRRLGTRLDSAATAGEGNQNLLCAYLAAGVLAGVDGLIG